MRVGCRLTAGVANRRPKPGSQNQPKTVVANPKMIGIRMFAVTVHLTAFSCGTGVQDKTGFAVPSVAGKVFRRRMVSSAPSLGKFQRQRYPKSERVII